MGFGGTGSYTDNVVLQFLDGSKSHWPINPNRLSYRLEPIGIVLSAVPVFSVVLCCFSVVLCCFSVVLYCFCAKMMIFARCSGKRCVFNGRILISYQES